MMAALVPAGVATVESTDAASPTELYPEELVTLGHAVATRRREFAAGRGCARRALAQLGFAPQAIPVGPERTPVWPDGVVGSITHCAGYSAAAVAMRTRVLGIGIDAEANEPLPDAVRSVAVTQEEDRLLRRLPSTGVAWDRVIFSAKEAFYKLWYPITQSWLGFDDVVVRLLPDDHEAGSGRFVVRLRTVPLGVGSRFARSFDGSFDVRDGRIVTVTVLCED